MLKQTFDLDWHYSEAFGMLAWRLLAVVRSSGQPGEIMLKAHTDELPSADLRLSTHI